MSQAVFVTIKPVSGRQTALLQNWRVCHARLPNHTGFLPYNLYYYSSLVEDFSSRAWRKFGDEAVFVHKKRTDSCV